MLEGIESRKAEILAYTRTPVPGEYPEHLANSIHFAVSRDGKYFEALNRNYGILFATSTIGADNTIHEKALKMPWLFRTADGGFAVAAIRVNADGSPDEEVRGSILLWTSRDLREFREVGPVGLGRDVHVAEVACWYDSSANAYRIHWRASNGDRFHNTMMDIGDIHGVSSAQPGGSLLHAALVNGPEGAVNGNVLEVDGSFCDKLALRWSQLHHVAIQVPNPIMASSAEDAAAVLATAFYSDGSTALKRVQWELETIDFGKPGNYELNGKVLHDQYPFPLARGYADPDILHFGGKFYFIATNDNTNAVGFYVREADTPAGLFAEDVKEHLILDKSESQGFSRCFWAPEFHLIGGSLYILCALAGDNWGPHSHMMKLKQGGSILDPNSWEAPVRVRKQDGSFLQEDGITLDMTYLKANGVSYLVWSYRKNIFTQLDTGSMLYIATIDEAAPWILTSEPVLLSRPLFGWENVNHTINNEGPYAIVTDDTVFLAFSGGAAGGYTYAVGLLTARNGDDLLNPDCWTKSSTPLLSHYSVAGEYGPGHNSFFTDGHGNLMIAYHAQETLTDTPRCTGIRRVHFNIEGKPVFDLSAERDLDPRLAHVCTRVTVM